MTSMEEDALPLILNSLTDICTRKCFLSSTVKQSETSSHLIWLNRFFSFLSCSYYHYSYISPTLLFYIFWYSTTFFFVYVLSSGAPSYPAELVQKLSIQQSKKAQGKLDAIVNYRMSCQDLWNPADDERENYP